MIKYKIGYYDVSDVVLGKGNFATVYLAIHKVSGCKVAMKIINRNDVKDEYVARNLHREARILAKLRHPNIIQLYESMTTKDLYCLSLELIKGVTLYQYFKIKLVPRLDENKAKLFFYQMLAAVQHMHHQKILHRDLKLENILIEHDQFVKIVDFGLSNVYYPKLIQRTHCGSMEYAAPELFHHISYSPAIDLWSLGVVLYSMVVGKMPFTLPRNGPISSQRRDSFVKRISKGLTQENWREMDFLTDECWNLILSLLQPDSSSRIRVEAALHHKWFKNNFELRHYLPEVRIDLRKKLRPEVITYLSDKLCTPAEKISRSVITYQHNHVSAMYNMTLDTLVKEIIHPPRDIEQSFLGHFERWRMTKLRPNRSDYVEPDTYIIFKGISQYFMFGKLLID
ncbi:hormonally up-regulated neu tumor-associated kinase-like [Uloborus diversus]|uniref:hormonally up-regulated neu tumor-associated kinase-like n=1 Tax=Uloborus diversus TaxID=327109 RepID=UPI00240A954B|nr:hormonally up-regulated neu tumor-associated kinase-like [Uloborus diversus]